jgi:hypothetical protein
MYEKRRLLEASDSDDDEISSEEDKFEFPDKKVAIGDLEE